jgi:adenosylhomocysteinase
MFNLAGPRPTNNSIESMDLGFALQARCLEAVANGSVDASSCVVPVPGRINDAIATSYLDRKYPAAPGVWVALAPRAGEVQGPARLLARP